MLTDFWNTYKSINHNRIVNNIVKKYESLKIPLLKNDLIQVKIIFGTS